MEESKSYQHQHVGNHDNIRLVPYRHARLEVVLSVFPVGHGEVGMKRDVVLLDALPGKKKRKETSVQTVLVLFLPRLCLQSFQTSYLQGFIAALQI